LADAGATRRDLGPVANSIRLLELPKYRAGGFGPLLQKQLEALATADPALLSRWGAKVLVAATLFDVFEDIK
jgi:hypothetical protein